MKLSTARRASQMCLSGRRLIITSNARRTLQRQNHPSAATVHLTAHRGVCCVQVLQLFDETRHELLLQRISAMNLQPLPPVLNTTSARWLGDRPGFY